MMMEVMLHLYTQRCPNNTVTFNSKYNSLKTWCFGPFSEVGLALGNKQRIPKPYTCEYQRNPTLRGYSIFSLISQDQHI